MAPFVGFQPIIPLRMVTQRLSNTQTTQLPHVAQFLAGSITESRKAFDVAHNESHKGPGIDTSVLIHKLKTQLSALLQDRSPYARFAAPILIKATIEVGGWNVLHGVGPWVRGMIGILRRPDSPSTKNLCVMTLARIFILTQEHQSLIREITTPSLAPFITAALNTLKPPTTSQTNRASVDHSFLLPSILQAFSDLIVLHPASFRPYLNQIQALVLPFIAPTPSHEVFEGSTNPVHQLTIRAAQQLFTLLHVCAPKNTAAEEWSKSLQVVLVTAHKTTDKVLRGFIEDGRPRAERSDVSNHDISEILSDRKPQPLGVPGWVGVPAGIERLDGLVNVIQIFISSSTSTAVTLPVSNVLDLMYRILAALQSSKQRGARWRPEIGRDEREAVEVGLPQLHVSAIRVLSSLLSRMGSGYMSLAQTTLEQVLGVLDIESENIEIRRITYTIISQILKSHCPTLSSSCILLVSRCVELCCEDTLPSSELELEESDNHSSKSAVRSENHSSATNVDSYLRRAVTGLKSSAGPSPLKAAAEAFLPLALKNLPRGVLSTASRTLIDRTMILTDNKSGMLASVMNPPVGKGQQATISVLPMFARAHDGELDFEALLRPQMPIVQANRASMDEETSYEEEEKKHDRENPERFYSGQSDSDFPFVHESTSYGDAGEAANGNTVVPFRVIHAVDSPTSIKAGDHPRIADIPQPVSDLSNTSHKRARDSDLLLSTDMEEKEAVSVRDATPVGEETSSKRVRLTPGEAEYDHQPVNSVTDDQPLAATITQPLLTQGGDQLEHLDSDESDFEKPILYLDDSDEEDDEDDEEEDN